MMCLFLQLRKGLALVNLDSWPGDVKQFNEVMVAGRKTIQKGMQTEVLASRSGWAKYTCYPTGFPPSFISMGNRPVGARNFLPNGTMQPSLRANSMPSLVPMGPRPVPK